MEETRLPTAQSKLGPCKTLKADFFSGTVEDVPLQRTSITLFIGQRDQADDVAASSAWCSPSLKQRRSWITTEPVPNACYNTRSMRTRVESESCRQKLRNRGSDLALHQRHRN
jgi:hypothetical protein